MGMGRGRGLRGLAGPSQQGSFAQLRFGISRQRNLLVGQGPENSQSHAESGKAGIRKIGAGNRPSTRVITLSNRINSENLEESEDDLSLYTAASLRQFRH